MTTAQTLRALGFLAWVLLLVAAPGLRRCGGVSSAWPAWRMYSGYSSGLCVMNVYDRDEQGALRELNRLDVLGFAGRHERAPEKIRRLSNFEAATTSIRNMCKEHKAPLYVDVRCQVGEKWAQRTTPERDACAAKAAAIKGAKR